MDNKTQEAFDVIREKISDHESLAEQMLVDTARNDGNSNDEIIAYADSMLNCIKELRRLKEILVKVEENLDKITSYDICLGDDEEVSVEKGLRKIKTALTQGMINQSFLTLTQSKKKGIVKIGEEFQITMPDGHTFTTKLVEPGNRLAERGAFGRFYRDNQVIEDTVVQMEEVRPGEWRFGLEPEIDLSKLI